MGPGEVLKHARQKQGLTLDMLAQAMKVKPEVLVAIESGETSHIPSVYLKGYIRNYARHLGISPESIEHHVAQARGSEPVVQSVFKDRLPRNPGDRWFKAGSYVLASAVVIALVWQFTNEAVRFSQGDPLLRPAQNSGNQQQAPQAADSDLDAAAGSRNEGVSGKTHLRASIASMNLPEEQASVRRTSVAEGAWAAIGNHDATAGNSISPAPAPGSDTLEIATSADSWIEIVDGNNQKIEMDLLRAGSRRTYAGLAPFHLLLGRASSVAVFHNGEKVDLAPYIRGNVARLTLEATEKAPESPAPESTAVDQAPTDQG